MTIIQNIVKYYIIMIIAKYINQEKNFFDNT